MSEFAKHQQQAPQARARVSAAAELPDLLPGGSAVAVEAGSKSGQSGQCAPQVEAAGGLLSAGGVGVSPGVLPAVFAAPEVQATCRAIKRVAGETHYPLVVSGSQMQLMERAISLAIDDVIEAMSDEPDGRDEIKPDLDAYNQIYRVLRAAKAAHKTPNENWRGMEL